MTSKLGTILTAVLLTLLGMQFALSRDGNQSAQIVLRDSFAPGKEAIINVPKALLSRRNSGELRENIAYTETLELTLRVPVKEGSRRKFPSVAEADRVHAFLQLVTQPQQDDTGKLYLEPYVQEAQRKNAIDRVVDLGNGHTKYILSGPDQQELYLRRDKTGRSIGTNCFQAVCKTHRTWEGIIRIYYYYGRALELQMAEVDSRVESILSEGLKRTR